MITVGDGTVELRPEEVTVKRLTEILMDSGISLVEAVIDVRSRTGIGDDEFWLWVLGVDDIEDLDEYLSERIEQPEPPAYQALDRAARAHDIEN